MDIDGLSALYDTLAAALLQPVEPARRHVVIAATKGRDTISSIDARAVRTIAERSDALFHLVMMETASDNEQMMGTFQCNPAFMGLCWPTRRFWVPFQRRLLGPWPVHQLLPDGQMLEAAAEATGGGLHRASGLSVPTLTSTFSKTFEDFRSSYVLRYTAQGVPRLGWHAIEVTIPGSKSYRVRARKGYGVEETTPSPPPRAAVPTAPRTQAELTLAYEAGGYRAVVSALRSTQDPARLIADFEKAGNPWPAMPRREAAFALELAEPGVFSTQPAARKGTHELLERFSRLIRQPLEPDVFERYWHFAALTLLEGAIRPAVTQAFVDRALERFPDEPRFVLSRAIVTDQRRVTGGNAAAGAGGTRGRPDAATVQRHYEAAVALPDTAAEARIRLAWFLYREGRQDEALAHLAAAETGSGADPSLRYLRLLFLGHVLRALERLDESVEAYRGAVAVIPDAQSARVALMNARLLEGHRVEAEALAEQVQTAKGPVVDPWWVYWQGQYRLHPQAMARVRELIR
jgi:tetratricopeptide (TPR) repeat protein